MRMPPNDSVQLLEGWDEGQGGAEIMSRKEGGWEEEGAERWCWEEGVG